MATLRIRAKIFRSPRECTSLACAICQGSPVKGDSDEEDRKATEAAQVLFGTNLRSARMRAGMSPTDLSEASGVARSTIYGVEKGKQNITFSSACALARAVGSTFPDLLSSPPCRKSNHPSEPPQTSGVSPPKPGTLAIELPAGDAYEIAMSVAARLDRQIPLIDPITREVTGLAARRSSKPKD